MEVLLKLRENGTVELSANIQIEESMQQKIEITFYREDGTHSIIITERNQEGHYRTLKDLKYFAATQLETRFL